MTEPSLLAPSSAMKPGRSLAMRILLRSISKSRYPSYLVESPSEFKGA
jgi:hypothetical protein